LAKRTEVTAYETSRTVRRLHLPQGIVRRLSISVLVDQDLRWNKVGKGAAAHFQKVIEPPSADRMKSIQSVVAAAAGFNEKRGDQLTVETLPFESTLTAEPPPSLTPAVPVASAPGIKLSPVMLGIGGGALLLVLTLFGALVRSRRKAKRPALVTQPQLGAQDSGVGTSVAGTETAQNDGSATAASGKSEQAPSKMFEAPLPFKLPPMLTTKTEVLTRQVAEEAHKDPAALAQVVRTWLSETKHG
jgi:flagellar M-ring protein FliF